MPGNDSNVLFSAEYDNTKFSAGVTENINNLRALADEQKRLQAVFDNTQRQLDSVQNELSDTAKQISNLDKTTKSYATTQQVLNDKSAALKQQAIALQEQLGKDKVALDNINSSATKTSDALLKVADSQKTVNAEIAKQPEIVPQVPVQPVVTPGSPTVAPTTTPTTPVPEQIPEQKIPVSLVFDDKRILDLLSNVKARVADVFKGFDFSAFPELQARLQTANGQVEQFSVFIDVAKEKLKTLAPDTKEFADVNDIIQVGEKFLKDYGDATDTTGTKTVSLRVRLRELRDELTQLEDSGKTETEQYKEVQTEAAKLTDQYSQMQQQIHILSSNTKGLDFGLSALNVAATGYQTVLGLTELLGVKNEDFAESEKKLLAVLNLVAGAQQLQELLLKENTFLTLGASYASKAYAAVNEFLAVSFGEAATAASVFRGILVTTGVGALVVALGYLVTKLTETNTEMKDSVSEQYNYNNAIEDSKSKVTDAIKVIGELRQNVELAKEGFIDKNRVVKEYNESIGKVTGAVKDLDGVETFLAQHADAYIQFTLLKAAANIALGKAADEAFKIEQANINIGTDQTSKQKVIADQVDAINKKNESSLAKQAEISVVLQNSGKVFDVLGSGAQKTKDAAAQAEKNLTDISNNLLDQAKELAKQNGFDLLEGQFQPDKAKESKIEDVYLQKLRELQGKLTDLSTGSVTTFDTIRAKVAVDIEGMNADLDTLFKDKKITAPELSDLKAVVGLIQTATLKKEFADYEKAREDAQKSIDDDLLKLRQDEAKKRIDNISDEFQQETAKMQVEYQVQRQTIVTQRETALKQANDDFASGLFGDPTSPQAQQHLLTVTSQYEGSFNKLFDDLDAYFARKKQDLAAKAFQTGLTAIEDAGKSQIGNIDESTNNEIIELGKLYTSGTINYDTYQKRLTEITQQQSLRRLEIQKNELTQQIAAIDIRSTNPTVNDSEFNDLQKQREGLAGQLSDVNKQISDATTSGYKSDEEKQNTHLHEMLNAYGSFVDGVLNFINVLDKAESDRLDRQIAYQNQRVTYAQQIAEKGNSDYLEMEQQRLDTLQAQQEEHAQKQLAIDNALTLSKAALAAVGAVADAVSSGNPFTAVAAVVAVIAAIAAGINFVNSFKVPVQQFEEGTEFVKLNGAKRGKDTVPAMLTEGERVTDARTNKDYKDALNAIQRKQIPAKVINEFVSNYSGYFNPPEMDYSRLGKATDNYFTTNTVDNNYKLSLIHEQLISLNETLEDLEPVNINIDEKGFSLTMIKSIRRMKLKRRS